ncbi:potassium voltage-gated channel protein Shaw-like [Acanthaster planci]|uniref:Potassium voltage-gated channel protein Shaw-like n=1 Tax=Acanthaster planci TaxID=133434 RepID=A0A8B7XS86_ACAPL|nr:potassium voltage-gated channel protein Shaw-like [Acanthaster planci]
MLPRMSVSTDRNKGDMDTDAEGEGNERLASAQLQSLRSSAPAGQDNKVRINVGGVRHETYKSTLKNIPDTRLAWLAQSAATNSTDYDPVTGEFFFDRHPRMFDAVLNYYRIGKLHAPRDVCGPAFEEELQFWGIDEKQIEACCWSYHTEHRDAQETLAKLNGPNFEKSDSEEEEDVARIFGIEEEYQTEKKSWYRRYQPRIWAVLDEPYSSRAAKVFAFMSLLFVVLSITTFCLETMENFRTTTNGTNSVDDIVETHISLFYIEAVCVTFFTVELVVRFAFCPNKLRFFITVENIIDIMAVIPFYVDLGERINGQQTVQVVNDFLSFLRIVRIFRIFKLARHLSGLKILVHTVRASAKELLLMIVFVTLVTLVSASLIYYAEKWTISEGDEEKNDFTDIPIGFWWTVVTITTVGYGDVVPRSWLGRIIGACTAIIGVLTLALPIPVIVNNFSLYYTHAQASQKLPKKRKRALVGAADVLKTHGNHMASSSISGYSTQSTNECDTNSLRSEDSCLRTVSGLVTANGSVKMPSSAIGEKTQISVYFTDEVSDSPSRARSPLSPSHGAAGKLSPSQQRRIGKRSSIMPSGHAGVGRRESFAPNGIANRQNGRSRSLAAGPLRPPPRRRSLLPSMTEVDM